MKLDMWIRNGLTHISIRTGIADGHGNWPSHRRGDVPREDVLLNAMPKPGNATELPRILG